MILYPNSALLSSLRDLVPASQRLPYASSQPINSVRYTLCGKQQKKESMLLPTCLWCLIMAMTRSQLKLISSKGLKTNRLQSGHDWLFEYRDPRAFFLGQGQTQHSDSRFCSVLLKAVDVCRVVTMCQALIWNFPYIFSFNHHSNPSQYNSTFCEPTVQVRWVMYRGI